MHRFVLGIAALAILLAAPGARAGTITIDFDLSSSVISILGGIITIPPDGTVTSASATVSVNGSGITNPVAGAAAMTGLTLKATVDATVGGSVVITGGFTGTQVGSATGSLTGGLANLVVGTLTLGLTGGIDCFGGLCPAIGTFPIVITGLHAITGVNNIGVGGFGSLSAATLNAILNLTIGGNAAVINLIGSEVSRTFTPSVPEPNTFAMFGLGIVGLAGIGWRRNRR
jgi:hypothetical protein